MELESALKLLGKQADEAEIFCERARSKTLEIKKGEVDLFKESTSTGYGIRVIKEKRMGFAFSNRLDETAIERALSSTKIAETDRYLALPRAQRYGRGGGFDSEIESLSTGAILELVAELLAPCADYDVIPTSGSITALSYEEEIANSHGVHGRDKETTISAHLSAVAKDTDVAPGIDRLNDAEKDQKAACKEDCCHPVDQQMLKDYSDIRQYKNGKCQGLDGNHKIIWAVLIFKYVL